MTLLHCRMAKKNVRDGCHAYFILQTRKMLPGNYMTHPKSSPFARRPNYCVNPATESRASGRWEMWRTPAYSGQNLCTLYTRIPAVGSPGRVELVPAATAANPQGYGRPPLSLRGRWGRGIPWGTWSSQNLVGQCRSLQFHSVVEVF